MTMNMRFVLATGCALLLSTASAFAAGDPEAGQGKSATCAACHGADGNSPNPEWPTLAGQHANYVSKQLLNYQSGERANAIMLGMAAGLSEEDIDDLSAFYARQSLQPGVADPDLVELGEVIYRAGDTSRGVAACSGCHGPAGLGNLAARFPRLAGQHAQYTADQMHQFRSGQRANDPNSMMRGVAANMTDQQIEAVASYIQGLRP